MKVGQTKEVEDISTNKLKLDEQSDKADSGMDEDSQPYNDQADDEDDEIITRKPRSKIHVAIFDEDEDSENSRSGLQQQETHVHVPLKTADEVLDAVLNTESGSELSNDSSSSDEDEKETLLSTLKKKKKIIKRTNIESDSEDNSDKDETKVLPAQTKPQVSLFGNSDLFDAEEDGESGAKNSGDDTASDSNHEGDEGFDETTINPKLLKKLKKGASKKASKPKRKVVEEEKLKLHSETQRLIRESRVNLPYHQPEPKPLQDFLARATTKQQQYRALRGARDSTKAKAVEEILTKTKLSSKDKVDKPCEKNVLTVDKSDVIEQLQTDNDKVPVAICGHEKNDNSDSLQDNHKTEDKESPVIGDKMDMGNSAEQINSVDLCTDSINSIDNNTTESESRPCADFIDETADQHISENLDSENKENECIDNISDTNIGTKSACKKLSLVSELPSLPKLSGGPENVIDLDVSSVTTVHKPGVSKFMDRFMEHSKKKHKHVSKDIELSVIQKEKTDTDQEELKLNTFVYHVTEEEGDSMSQFDAPGAKLVALKEKLQQKMKAKREEHRKQRQEVFDLDNEEGYGKEVEDEVLDNDQEMTDESDTDVEDDEFDEQFGDEEFEEEEKEENPFCDNEAEVDENEEEDDDEMELRLHLSDDEEDVNNCDEGDEKDDEEDEDIKPKKPSSLKKKARVLAISDDEESKMSVPEKSQNNSESVTEKTTNNCDESVEEENFTPFSKHISGTQPPAKKSLPGEGSQELCGTIQNTERNNFYIEESQMLDADGFLKFGSEKKPQQKPTTSPSFNNLLQTQESGDMDELLGLCSGRFVDDDKRTSCKNLFGLTTQSGPENTQGKMDEFMGFCSGKFVSNTQATQQPSGIKRKRTQDFDEDSTSSLQMTSYAEEEDFVVKDKNTFSDEELDEVDGDTNSVTSEKQSRPFKGILGKSGKIRKEFVDEEAELSGSEYDSDENLDLAEEDDIMEEELGDNDVTATEEELRNQVGRAHLKQMIDDDKRELMRFQEMYLPDGDLHSDAGRMRRFKWNNMDDDTQQDMFDDRSDNENEEEEGEEAKWRKDRFEREKWLQEQQLQEDDKIDDEDSQFLKLGKVFLKRRDSDSSVLKKPEATSTKAVKPLTVTAVPKPSIQRRGSFLGRDKDTLAKIANMTKAVVNPSGARNSGKFVFQVLSPDKDTKAMPAPSEPSVKKTTNKQPPAKKPRLERSASFSQSSIFNHL